VGEDQHKSQSRKKSQVVEENKDKLREVLEGQEEV
jgi:hypothetical protein